MEPTAIKKIKHVTPKAHFPIVKAPHLIKLSYAEAQKFGQGMAALALVTPVFKWLKQSH